MKKAKKRKRSMDKEKNSALNAKKKRKLNNPKNDALMDLDIECDDDEELPMFDANKSPKTKRKRSRVEANESSPQRLTRNHRKSISPKKKKQKRSKENAMNNSLTPKTKKQRPSVTKSDSALSDISNTPPKEKPKSKRTLLPNKPCTDAMLISQSPKTKTKPKSPPTKQPSLTEFIKKNKVPKRKAIILGLNRPKNKHPKRIIVDKKKKNVKMSKLPKRNVMSKGKGSDKLDELMRNGSPKKKKKRNSMKGKKKNKRKVSKKETTTKEEPEKDQFDVLADLDAFALTL